MNEEARLLYHFAQIVALMRDAQKQWSEAHPNGGTPELFALEREVDSLAALHLLPPIPNAPYIAQGGAK